MKSMVILSVLALLSVGFLSAMEEKNGKEAAQAFSARSSAASAISSESAGTSSSASLSSSAAASAASSCVGATSARETATCATTASLASVSGAAASGKPLAIALITDYKHTQRNSAFITNLVEQGFSVRSSNDDGISPFSRAVRLGNLDLIGLLIDLDAKHPRSAISEPLVDAPDENDLTPLWLALFSRNHGLMTLLLKKGACVTKQFIDSLTSENADKRIVELIAGHLLATRNTKLLEYARRNAFVRSCEILQTSGRVGGAGAAVVAPDRPIAPAPSLGAQLAAARASRQLPAESAHRTCCDRLGEIAVAAILFAIYFASSSMRG